LKRIEHRGQTQIEDSVENQDIHAHGNYDINTAVLANDEWGLKTQIRIGLRFMRLNGKIVNL